MHSKIDILLKFQMLNKINISYLSENESINTKQIFHHFNSKPSEFLKLTYLDLMFIQLGQSRPVQTIT